MFKIKAWGLFNIKKKDHSNTIYTAYEWSKKRGMNINDNFQIGYSVTEI